MLAFIVTINIVFDVFKFRLSQCLLCPLKKTKNEKRILKCEQYIILKNRVLEL
jgi:hypothetical protein